MAKSKAQGGSFSRVVVSPSLLAQIDATNCKPKHRFLLGLGKPFELNPWDSEDDKNDFLMASQMSEKELTQSKLQPSDQWGSPKSSAKLNLLHKDGIPKSANKQMNWSLSLCGLSGRAILPRILCVRAQTRIYSQD